MNVDITIKVIRYTDPDDSKPSQRLQNIAEITRPVPLTQGTIIECPPKEVYFHTPYKFNS